MKSLTRVPPVPNGETLAAQSKLIRADGGWGQPPQLASSHLEMLSLAVVNFSLLNSAPASVRLAPFACGR